MTRMKAISRRFTISVILVHCMMYCIDRPEKKSNMRSSAGNMLRNIHRTLAVTQCREVNYKKKKKDRRVILLPIYRCNRKLSELLKSLQSDAICWM